MVESGLSILLVEDDQLDAMHVERELRKLQITAPLIKCRNGREALDRLQGTAVQPPLEPLPSVVLLDINMPRMNGLEFLAEIRRDPRLRDLQVFIMTTSDEETDRARAHELGVVGYIVKPLTFERFGEGGTGVDGFSLFVELLKLK
ncbi:MAG: response regulator [Hymenobacteraceae bacterium]|nr:response regulator [Hymenobacteraceae bacterium]